MSPSESHSKSTTTVRVFSARPTKEQVLAEVSRFFSLLQEVDVEAAGASVAHTGDDWWPHQIRSLWQDLVGPWLEEQGEEWELDDDRSWRDLSWLEKIGAALDTEWDAREDRFYVNVIYDGVLTDVSAEFRLHEGKDGWVVRREIIHVA